MVTPVTMREVILGKLIPYFILGMGGHGACRWPWRVWLFEVPLRGSLWVLFGASALFLLAALGMGLLISTIARSQFVAGQIAIITTFLPAFMLSGFIFDIGSMPRDRAGHHPCHRGPLLRRRFCRRYFWPGNMWSVILPNTLALLADGRDFPRPEPPQIAQTPGIGTPCAAHSRPDDQGVPGPAQGQAQPRGPVRAAADSVDGVRLCGNLRSQPHSVRGLQRRRGAESRELLARFRRLSQFPAGRRASPTTRKSPR